jgi:hypothetical protein
VARGQRKGAVAIALLVVAPTASPNFGCKAAPGQNGRFAAFGPGRAGPARATLPSPPNSAGLRWSTRRRFDSSSSPSATLRHSSPLYPIVRNCRKTTEELRDSGLTLRASCSFPPWVRRTVLPPLHCSPLYPIVRSDSKTTSNAIKAGAVNFRDVTLITVQTVASGRGFGGCISRGRTHDRQAQAARRRTQNSARQIPRFNAVIMLGPIPIGANLLTDKETTKSLSAVRGLLEAAEPSLFRLVATGQKRRRDLRTGIQRRRVHIVCNVRFGAFTRRSRRRG